MPLYKYIAKDITGRTVRGFLESEDAPALNDTLRERNLFMISHRLSAKQERNLRFSAKDLAEFNRQLSAMLSSGISLLRSVEIILRRDLKSAHRKVYEKLHLALRSGKALSDAMEAEGGVFPPLLINMYRAGEANGTIDLTAQRMADHYDKEFRLHNKIRSASTYPLVLLALTIVVMIIIFTYVLPSFTGLYGDAELPAITRAVLAVSTLFTDYPLLLLIGAVLLVLLVRMILQLPNVRISFDRRKLKLPLFGRLLRTVATARFSRTLSSLYSSGLSIMSALEIARGTVGNAYIALQFNQLLNDVRVGMPLSGALDKIVGFDKKLSSTVLVGEESGRLESMLLSVADSFDYEAQESTQRMVTILEPLLIIVMALIIGAVMIAVLLPIYGMYTNMSSHYGI